MIQNNRLVEYRCPACQGNLDRSEDNYRCHQCARDFPIFFGIPDFRLSGDAYLSLGEERDKAGKLAALATHASFEELLDYYYSITDDVTPELAARYRRYILNGPANAAHLVNHLELDNNKILLDAGCGTGSFAIAAHASVGQLYVLDIALRWLIICRKRLKEKGLSAQYVCADICNMPFPDGSFDAVGALDVLEHTHDPMAAIDSTVKALAPEGRICVTGSNRFVLGPHPSGRIWFAGYMPPSLRSWVSKVLRGYDSLRHTRLLSPFSVQTRFKQSGLVGTRLWPRRIGANVGLGYSSSAQWLLRIYRKMSESFLLRPLMITFGPTFELTAARPAIAVNKKETTE